MTGTRRLVGAVLAVMALAVSGCGATPPSQEQATRTSAQTAPKAVHSDPATAQSRPVDARAVAGSPVTRVLTRLVNYRVPFLVWGPTVASGAGVYGLNPDYANPGDRRPSYSDARQPVRNGAVANLALDLLALDAVNGSEHDRAQDLDWR